MKKSILATTLFYAFITTKFIRKLKMTQKQPLQSLLLRLVTVTALCILSTVYAVAADDQLSLDDAIEQSVEEPN